MSYMLDFKGQMPELEVSSEVLQEAIETMDLKSVLSKFGALPDQVAAWCESRHLRISDRGIGGDRWHIGIPFEDPLLALSMMLAAERQFEYALRKGWLSLHLMSWGKLDGPMSGHGISAPQSKPE